MCGIIGYIGSKPVVPVLIEGLRKMEYRGYDSAGVALVSPEGISLRRSAGKLVNLENVIEAHPVDGLYGVGHTRWATHGRPTEENAHPHRDCTGRIVVVHNGIIENYLELKEELQSQGHEFKTETDTEIVAHLVEREMKTDGLENAVRRALKLMRGMFAVVLVSVEDPEKIVAVRNGPPIVIGLGDDEFFVASDIPAILAHTRDVVFLGDEEMAVITRSGVDFTDFTGRAVSKTTQRVLWDPIAAEKGGHKHFMLKEIYEQPTAARDTIIGRVSLESGKIFLADLNIDDETIRAAEKVTIVACGTSWHAALVGKYLIEALAQVPVEVDYGSEYRYRNPIVAARELTIVITQSGETADTLAALREARRKGAKTIAICNVVGSMATREADGTVYTHAGPEIGVASTKAFTSQLVALQLLALYLAQVRQTLEPEAIRRHIGELLKMPLILEQAIKASSGPAEKVAERFHNRADFLFLGRGINYPIALEGALKLKEISYIHAEGYPAGEMKHGPIALIDEQMPVVAIAPNDHVFEKMIGNVQEAKARGGSVIAITSEGDSRMAAVLSGDDMMLPMPETTPLLTPIVMTIPLQLLAYHIAVRRGCDVDQPRNLAKSVTVE
jgi:glutamine---fructose-6-phosphate transaminase (isomerizing)